MKKTITIVALLAGAVSAYSQGQIVLNDYSGASGLTFIVFGQQPAANSIVLVTYAGQTVGEVQGNASSVTYSYQSPSGSTLYPNANPLGTGYSVGLLAAPGDNQAVSSLLPGSTPATVSDWGSGFAGVIGLSATGVWNTITSGDATCAIAAWQNTGASGAAATLAAAIADNYKWGTSAPFNVTPTYAPNAGVALPYNNAQDFSLGVTVPEPSTIALGVIGASAFLLRLRRNK